MRTAAKYLLCGVAAAMIGTAPAMAADYIPPSVVETPTYPVPEVVPAEVSGWYLRGDVGYAWHKFRTGHYAIATDTPSIFTNSISETSFRGSYTVGAGVGYKFNNYLRADTTIDWWSNGKFTGYTVGSCGAAPNCTSTDIATFSALTVMANAYVDFGTYGRVTPYVGGGFGGSYVRWGELANTACQTGNSNNCDSTVYHEGESGWRFAYALMAGASVDITCSTAIDVGYKYQKIVGGEMFGTVDNTGYGHDGGIDSHQVKAGLRYKFGGCQQPAPQPYPVPEPLPVYK